MPITVDSNIKLLANRLHITSSRIKEEYGMSTVDEIIESEAGKGNVSALDAAREYGNSPDKLVELFHLFNVENRYSIIREMDESTRMKVLPFLEQDDLVMGLNFFTQEKLLRMLLEVDIVELVQVVLMAFPVEQIMAMYTEEDLAKFFLNKDLRRVDVMEQLSLLPPEFMQKFVEGVTGRPSEETNPADIFASLNELPDDKFRKFMASIDPEVQRQLTFQLTTQEPAYMTLFENMTYVNMLSTLMKPDLVPAMVMLKQETLINMLSELPPEFISVIGAQIKPKDLAFLLQDGNLDILKNVRIM